ncbi:kinase-like protein [Gigaspora margarita]|uniref:Kinase-like protein n=1 Tax=Gigaspora margarita TaxID=4874 RepID=A0A8H4EJS3_GIGMA|nr:kinase-like protein [Gigaspora margarita]
MSNKKGSHDPNKKMKRLVNLQKWFKDSDVIEYEYSYENKKEIGSGGFGTVYSAERDGKMFALKSFKNNDMNNEVTKEFIKELKLLHAISSHPNINLFYGITRDPETNKLMLVLQFANGGNLRQYLERKWQDGIFGISLNEVIRISKQITNGLGHLHKNNIIHCDLHPKNILINDDKILIADFGLSRKIGDTYTSSTSITKGMPAYLDPHCCFQAGKKPDEKSDIYSLGVIFWELTSGIPPFANAISGLVIIVQAFHGYRETTIPSTPTEYAKLYKKCWNIEPKERPTICKILENLNAISKKETITLITNRNRELTPELETTISKQSQIYKNMLNDDLSKIFLKPAWFKRSSNPSPKPSVDSLPKASSAPSPHSSPKNTRTKSIKDFFLRQKLDDADELKSQGQIYYMSGNYKESLEYLNNSLNINPNDADALRN